MGLHLPLRVWFWTGILVVALCLGHGLYGFLAKDWFIFYLNLGRMGLFESCNAQGCMPFNQLSRCYTSSACIDYRSTPISLTYSREILITLEEDCNIYSAGDCSWSLSFSFQNDPDTQVFGLHVPAHGAEVWSHEYPEQSDVTCYAQAGGEWQLQDRTSWARGTGWMYRLGVTFHNVTSAGFTVEFHLLSQQFNTTPIDPLRCSYVAPSAWRLNVSSTGVFDIGLLRFDSIVPRCVLAEDREVAAAPAQAKAAAQMTYNVYTDMDSGEDGSQSSVKRRLSVWADVSMCMDALYLEPGFQDSYACFEYCRDLHTTAFCFDNSFGTCTCSNRVETRQEANVESGLINMHVPDPAQLRAFQIVLGVALGLVVLAACGVLLGACASLPRYYTAGVVLLVLAGLVLLALAIWGPFLLLDHCDSASTDPSEVGRLGFAWGSVGLSAMWALAAALVLAGDRWGTRPFQHDPRRRFLLPMIRVIGSALISGFILAVISGVCILVLAWAFVGFDETTGWEVIAYAALVCAVTGVAVVHTVSLPVGLGAAAFGALFLGTAGTASYLTTHTSIGSLTMLSGAISEGILMGFTLGVWTSVARVSWTRSEERLVMQDTMLSLGGLPVSAKRSRCKKCRGTEVPKAMCDCTVLWTRLSLLLGTCASGALVAGLEYAGNLGAGMWIWGLLVDARWEGAMAAAAFRAVLHASAMLGASACEAYLEYLVARFVFVPRRHAAALKTLFAVMNGMLVGKLVHLLVAYILGTPLALMPRGTEGDQLYWIASFIASSWLGLEVGYLVWGDSGGQPLLCHHVVHRHYRLLQLLLAGQADADTRDLWGRNALHYLQFPSARRAPATDRRIARLLLRYGAAPEVRDESGRTALAAAVWYGNEDLLPVLIEGGASATSQDRYGRSPLHYALDCTGRCSDCTVDLLPLLPGVKGSVDVQDSDGETPMHLACRWHDPAVVKLLLGARASLSVGNVLNEQPLQLAAANRKWGCGVLELLLQEGADITHCSSLGGVLHYGAQDEAVVQLLVTSACDPNLATAEGWTALHHCCDLKQVAGVANLLRHTAIDVNLPDQRGFTALHIAVQEGDPDIIRSLLRAGADVQAQTFKHQLKPAFFAGTKDVEELFASGADRLLEAACCEADDIRELLSEGLDPNVRSSADWTPLMTAALHDNVEAVDALLEANADPAAELPSGTSAALWARWRSSWQCLRLLQAFGHEGTPADLSAVTHKKQALELYGADQDVQSILALSLQPSKGPLALSQASKPRRVTKRPAQVRTYLHNVLEPEYRPEGSLLEYLQDLGSQEEAWTGADSNPSMQSLIWEAQVFTCQKVAEKGAFASPAAIFTLFVYTCESELCYGTNRALRENDHTALQKYKPFIFYLSSALSASLKSRDVQVYRGVKLQIDQDFYDLYTPGTVVPFYAFTSTSTSYRVANEFAGENSNGGVIFAIQSSESVKMAIFSKYPTEDEFLLPPGCQLQVKRLIRPSLHESMLPQRQPLTIEEMQQLRSVVVLLEQVRVGAYPVSPLGSLRSMTLKTQRIESITKTVVVPELLHSQSISATNRSSPRSVPGLTTSGSPQCPTTGSGHWVVEAVPGRASTASGSGVMSSTDAPEENPLASLTESEMYKVRSVTESEIERDVERLMSI